MIFSGLREEIFHRVGFGFGSKLTGFFRPPEMFEELLFVYLNHGAALQFDVSAYTRTIPSPINYLRGGSSRLSTWSVSPVLGSRKTLTAAGF